MEFTLQPVAFVRATRQEVTDDSWGGEHATIELVDGTPGDSFDGLESFSHAEILLVFHKLDPAAVPAGARHPRKKPPWSHELMRNYPRRPDSTA